MWQARYSGWLCFLDIGRLYISGKVKRYDINMPGTNGFALIELLRKSNIGNSRTIPIVAMTARDDDDSPYGLNPV